MAHYMSQLRKKKKRTNRFVFSASTFAFVVFLTGFTACKDKPIEPAPTPEGDVYYIVGYNLEKGVDTADRVGKANIYLLAPEYLKDALYDSLFLGLLAMQWSDSLYEAYYKVFPDFLCTTTLPDTLFDFPATLVRPWGNNYFGFYIFPNEYIWKYKVRITYNVATSDKEVLSEPYFNGMQQVFMNSVYFYPRSKKQMIFITSITRSN